MPYAISIERLYGADQVVRDGGLCAPVATGGTTAGTGLAGSIRAGGLGLEPATTASTAPYLAAGRRAKISVECPVVASGWNADRW
jgi:hypothetical protein